MALPNILPLPLVQEALQLYVAELELAALTETSLLLTVGDSDSSQPLKVTLCWMDPTNSVLSAKLLLHDIDLVVQQTGEGGGRWYGKLD